MNRANREEASAIRKTQANRLVLRVLARLIELVNALLDHVAERPFRPPFSVVNLGYCQFDHDS
jgi:hypothetical protein